MGFLKFSSLHIFHQCSLIQCIGCCCLGNGRGFFKRHYNLTSFVLMFGFFFISWCFDIIFLDFDWLKWRKTLGRRIFPAVLKLQFFCPIRRTTLYDKPLFV